MRRFLVTGLLIGCALLSALPAIAADVPIHLAILTGDGDRAVSDATLAQVEKSRSLNEHRSREF